MLSQLIFLPWTILSHALEIATADLAVRVTDLADRTFLGEEIN